MSSRRRPSGGSAEDREVLPLELDEVSFHAGSRCVIDRVSCRFESGLRSIILGANGAGKSVLMRLCHGLLTPTGGTIAWRERDARKDRQAMVFQRPVMLRRSALENVIYALDVAGLPRRERRERASAALERVGLRGVEATSARVLSVGEQQRLALARAWALAPEVLFLDEPTASLDPTAAREVEAVIEAIRVAGTKIIMTTHNLGQARRLGDEILFLHAGRLLERRDVESFFSSPSTAEAAAFIKGETPWK